eukprot:GHVU01088521.1.p1 GENE.GHVU01088521.1~~GHVU01088521.1.p1  ORF type:complete len:125 (+),score=7.01 GHVU01088521.1:38-412(+)
MCACVSVCVCLCVCVCECVCVYLPLGVEDENVDLADAVLPENPREASLAPGGGSGRPDTTQAGEQRERLRPAEGRASSDSSSPPLRRRQDLLSLTHSHHLSRLSSLSSPLSSFGSSFGPTLVEP